MNTKVMNTLSNLLGVLAVTTVVATGASVQGVASERDAKSQPDPGNSHHSATASRGRGAFASAPDARTPSEPTRAAAFDGDWSVVITTQSGSCDREYRYGMRIDHGEVLNAGSGSVTLEGHVAPSGAVQVSVAAGGQEAHGAGRLARASGSGTWRGAGSAGGCAGTWVAERRQ